MRRLGTVALALVSLAGCSCGAGPAGFAADGGDAAALRDRGPEAAPDGAVGDAPDDSAGGCDLPDEIPDLPARTHRAVVVYDRFLIAPEGYSAGGVNFAFADADGIALFAGQRFLRATFDGNLVQALRLPAWPRAVAQSPAGYGFEYRPAGSGLYDLSFCLFDELQADNLDPCMQVGAGGAFPTWDGTAFRVLGHCDAATMCLFTMTPAGTIAEPVRYAAHDESAYSYPLFIPDYLVMLTLQRRDPPSCKTALIESVPRSLDFTQRRSWELVPSSFEDATAHSSVSNGRRAAVLTEMRCFEAPPSDYPMCMTNQSHKRVTLLTIVGEDGAPIGPSTRLTPLLRATPLVWDGARFLFSDVHVAPSDPKYGVAVHAFDENGEFQVWSAPMPLSFRLTGENLRNAQLAVIGENDYIVAYGLDSGTYLARFSLVPL